MKRLCPSILCLLLLFPTVSLCETTTAETPEIVAEVNGEFISRKALNAELRSRYPYQTRHWRKQELHELRLQVLRTIADNTLLKQHIADWQKKKQSRYRQTAATDILPPGHIFTKELYFNELVYGEVSLSEEDLTKHYRTNLSRFTEPNEFHIRTIFIKHDSKALAPDSTPEQKIQKLLFEARKEKSNFAELARRNSEEASRADGGDRGFVTLNQLPTPLANAVQQLSPGKVSDIIQTDDGYFIIKLEEKRGGDTIPFQTAKATLRQLVISEQRRQAAHTHIEKLRKRGKVILYLN